MKPHQLGVQLYTLRDICRSPKETADVVAKVAAIGYRAIEVAGICPIDSSELRAMADGAGVEICAIHDDPVAVLENSAQVLERALEVGCKLVVYTGPVGFDLGCANDVKRLVEKLGHASQVFQGGGVTLCYHNHSKEFARYENQTVLHGLFHSPLVSELAFELDTYWVQHGGGDPIDWCQRMKNRLPILHLKDYGAIGGTPTMMEIGQGNLDFPGILKAARNSKCSWYVVEQDICLRPPLESLQISFDYLKALCESGSSRQDGES